MSILQDIRLACMECDREDYDPTTLEKAIGDGWDDISYCPPTENWWTHLGYCPKCRDQVEGMRLKCVYCGPPDGLLTDTTTARAAGWTGIIMRPVPETKEERADKSTYTHLGLCADCSRIVEPVRPSGE